MNSLKFDKNVTNQKYTDIGKDNAKRCSQVEIVAQMTATIATRIVNDLLFNFIAFKKPAKTRNWNFIQKYWILNWKLCLFWLELAHQPAATAALDAFL